MGYKKSIHASLSREIRNALTDKGEQKAIAVYQKYTDYHS